MKNLDLLPHNQFAVNKVTAHFNSGKQRAAIVHPTGTGKSYCIAAIAENFNNIAVIAPNKYVLGQIMNVCKNRKMTCYTYSKITRGSITTTGYDLIVIDELHRMGGRKWEIGINNFLKANPNAKVLGTTATPIRFLDGGRDITEDYFKDDVVSKIELADAMVSGILPVPHYVVGFYSLNVLEELAQQETRNIIALRERVSSIREKWETSNGVSGIINRHVSPDTKRAIIFFKSIEDLERNGQCVEEWFRDAGFKVHKTYTVHSKSPENLEDFEQNNYEGIKLLYCVNMLNEGIHVSGVDVVVFLRNTKSRNIWFQQMGRVLGCNKRKSVILDLVANSRNTIDIGYIKNIQEMYNKSRQKQQDRSEEIEDFDITDETEDFIKIMKGIDLVSASTKITELYNFGLEKRRKPDPILESDLYNTLVEVYRGFYYKRFRDQELIEKTVNLFNTLKFELLFKVV